MDNKKYVGLLTLDSRIYNYGGMLQEYALYKTIENLGYECEIIDYDVSSELNIFSLKRSICNVSMDKIKDIIRRKLLKNKIEQQHTDEILFYLNRRYIKFDTFRNQLKYSSLFKYPQLESAQLKYFAIVCGSDQIWNPDFSIPSFFLYFVPAHIRKIIYAASIGKKKLSKRQQNIYNNLLCQVDAISVREKSVQDIFKDKCLDLVVDPTLLIDQGYWIDMASKIKINRKNYIFTYLLDFTSEEKNAVEKFAKENKLDILSIPFLQGKYNPLEDTFGEKCCDVGPIEFLGFIYNADFIITDSFHATLFSILFDKIFRVFGRMSGLYNMNTRLETLLGYFAMEKCMINPKDLSISHDYVQGDWKKFHIVRERSYSFLDKALKCVNEGEDDVH